MAKTVRLISPLGVAVTVDASKVDALRTAGFTAPERPAKTPTPTRRK